MLRVRLILNQEPASGRGHLQKWESISILSSDLQNRGNWCSEEAETAYGRERSGRLAAGGDCEAKPPRDDQGSRPSLTLRWLWFGLWAPSSVLGGVCRQWFRSCQALLLHKPPPPSSHIAILWQGMNIKTTLAKKLVGSLLCLTL